MKTSNPATRTKPPQYELLSGFVRLHILHHAAKDPVMGAWIMEELGHHGYRLSPGTVYPMLRALEQKGYLRSAAKRSGRRSWREYRATRAGRKVLADAKIKLRELFHELIEESQLERKEQTNERTRKRTPSLHQKDAPLRGRAAAGGRGGCRRGGE